MIRNLVRLFFGGEDTWLQDPVVSPVHPSRLGNFQRDRTVKSYWNIVIDWLSTDLCLQSINQLYIDLLFVGFDSKMK